MDQGSVNEGEPELFELYGSAGLNRLYTYTDAGDLESIALRNGYQGGDTDTQVLLREYEYYTKTISGVGSIEVPSKVTVYCTDASPIVTAETTYSYAWYVAPGSVQTFQVETRTTTLPVVHTTEHSTGTTDTIVEGFDVYGFRMSVTDPYGIVTTTSYFWETGAVAQVVQADGNPLERTSDFEADALGRMTKSLGPVHMANIGGIATEIRTASWTQYLDAADQVRSFRGYETGSGPTAVVIGPISIQLSCKVQDSGEWTRESIGVAYSGSVPDSTEDFPQTVSGPNRWVSWSVQIYSLGNELTESRVYHHIPGSTYGSNGTNYARTLYGFDAAGRVNEVTNAVGTITKTTFNAMGWTMMTEVGTDSGNLLPTALNTFDTNGNVETATLPVNSSSGDDRVQTLTHDWRLRLETVTQEVQSGLVSPSTYTLMAALTYDNRDNVIERQQFQITSGPILLALSESLFDLRNRNFQNLVYGVTAGTLLYPLTSNRYFDKLNRVMQDVPAGKVGLTITQFDALGQILGTYTGYGFPTPGSPNQAIVMEQAEYVYDEAGLRITTVSKQRFDDADENEEGPLSDPNAAPEARVSLAADYFDPLGRPVAHANYGTNNGESWERPDDVPERADDVLVDSWEYDDAGNKFESIDPAGTVTRQEFDDAARVIKTINNYIVVHGSSSSGMDTDKNQTQRLTYNGINRVVESIFENPITGNQQTTYTYGVVTSGSCPSDFNSKDLLFQEIRGLPDRSITTTYGYNRQGQIITKMDNAGTTHEYNYDLLGRETADTVTAFGSGVDTYVNKIATVYNVNGLIDLKTSLGGSSQTTARNQVKLEYDGYNDLNKDWQEPDGEVDGSTLFVEYLHAGGLYNTNRLVGMIYPDNGMELRYDYTTAAGNALSRPDSITEVGSPDAAIVSYKYLGLSIMVNINYDAASNVQMTYVNGLYQPAGDKYSGLDQWGRVVETIWKNTGGDMLVHSKYGLTPFSKIQWRKDEVAANMPSVTGRDDYYWYDGLYRVEQNQRGDLIGMPPYFGVTNVELDETIAFDSISNRLSYGSTGGSDFTEDFQYNTANEITRIVSPAGAMTPVYDAGGYIETFPSRPALSTNDSCAIRDAWGRITAVHGDSSEIVTGYRFDGLARRIFEELQMSEIAIYCNLNGERLLSFNGNGQEKVYLWGMAGPGDLVLEKTSNGSLLQLFPLRDNGLIVAVINTVGTGELRFRYEAMGQPNIMTFNYVPIVYSAWRFIYYGSYYNFELGWYVGNSKISSPELGVILSLDGVYEERGCCECVDEVSLEFVWDRNDVFSTHGRGLIPLTIDNIIANMGLPEGARARLAKDPKAMKHQYGSFGHTFGIKISLTLRPKNTPGFASATFWWSESVIETFPHSDNFGNDIEIREDRYPSAFAEVRNVDGWGDITEGWNDFYAIAERHGLKRNHEFWRTRAALQDRTNCQGTTHLYYEDNPVIGMDLPLKRILMFNVGAKSPTDPECNALFQVIIWN